MNPNEPKTDTGIVSINETLSVISKLFFNKFFKFTVRDEAKAFHHIVVKEGNEIVFRCHKYNANIFKMKMDYM